MVAVFLGLFSISSGIAVSHMRLRGLWGMNHWQKCFSMRIVEDSTPPAPKPLRTALPVIRLKIACNAPKTHMDLTQSRRSEPDTKPPLLTFARHNGIALP